jgi:hypothetical protein
MLERYRFESERACWASSVGGVFSRGRDYGVLAMAEKGIVLPSNWS